MRIISYKRIREAEERYPQASNALKGWYRVMKNNKFNDFSELRNTFSRSVDVLNNFFIFDIGGNKLRMITWIHFYPRYTVYIKCVLTHKEYDNGHWKKKNG